MTIEIKSIADLEAAVKERVSFTCTCGCATFDGVRCRRCGNLYQYGEVDYDELRTLIASLRKSYAEIVEKSKGIQKDIEKEDMRKWQPIVFINDMDLLNKLLGEFGGKI